MSVNRHMNRSRILWIATLGVIICGMLVTPWSPAGRLVAGPDDTATKNKPKSRKKADRKKGREGKVMKVFYLEIVTPEVDAVCATYEVIDGVKFGKADAGLGNARTAAMPDGGMVGVRAPLRDTETPVVRPYWLVDDIKAAVNAAVKAGGELAHPPLEIPGHGTFAIYIHGGIEHGLWQK